MSNIRVTVRAYIPTPSGGDTIVERVLTLTGVGGNPIFFGDAIEQATKMGAVQVREAVEAIHGTAPGPARVEIH